MIKKSVVIINNEKVFKQGEDFFCFNFDMKVLSEGLNEYNYIEFIVRSSKKKGEHKLSLKNIKSASNIFKFIYFILKTLKTKNTSYLLVDITPYTFFSFLFWCTPPDFPG